MAKADFIFAILLIGFTCRGQPPDSWSQKANFVGGIRYGATSFSIGTKGYVGSGYDGNHLFNDFWEYDEISNTWTQKANFGGSARIDAVGFAIGTKGYFGTGWDGNFYNDFWEYDQGSNLWTQKGDFGGVVRADAVGFSIGTKGYIGIGSDGGFHYYNDFWEYNPSTNSWTQKANFNGTARDAATAFVIGAKGYVGLGSNGTVFFNDFWEYDSANNSWSQRANFGGTSRELATGFVIGENGYMGTGLDGSRRSDLWEYDAGRNTWLQKANLSASGRQMSISFACGTKGYLGTGFNGNVYLNDFWEYYPGVITTGNVPFNKCQGSNFNLTFSSPDTFNNTNLFSAQLSDSSGSFGSANIIGSVAATTALSGTINVTIPQTTPLGSGYRIRVISSNPIVIGDNSNNITITQGDVLSLKCFIQGYYLNGSTMQPVLYNEHVDTNSASTNVDTVLVELHDSAPPYSVIDSSPGILQIDGTVSCTFSCDISGNSYYIAIKHRNAIQTWSATPVLINASTTYDFTPAANQAFGNNMFQVDTSIWAFYSGDINQDENTDLIDFPLWEYGYVHGSHGYEAADLNGDGNVDLMDFPFLDLNINNAIYSQHP